MIEILPESQDNVLGIKASGKVTAEDYETVLIPKLDSLLAEHARGKFLYYLPEEFEGFEVGAMWDDAKYYAGHSDKFDKVALVGGPKWIEWTTKIAGLFVKAEIKTFSEDQMDEAWSWLKS
ncbi:MAG: STAS/SEC14 domain-containing protein [Candidatus Omnitrophota bacterium]